MTLDHDGLTFGGELARRHPAALNVLLVGVYVAVVASLSLTSADGTGGASNAGSRIVAAAAMGLPLLGRTRWPLPVFVATLALSSLALVAGIARDWFVGPALALYEVADRAPSTRSELTRAIVIATAVIAVALVVAGSAAPPSQVAEGLAVGAVVLGVGWILGWVGRERREYRAAAAAAQVQQAVAEERLRVAREIHDVVAHGVSLIVVRASVASHVMDRRPDEARDALAMIESTGRESLRELRRVVGALRAGDPPDGAPAGVEPPLGGPADLRAIADAVAPAGVRVELDADDLAPLSPLVAATVHRVVQEALTNVVRHAAPTTCRIMVRITADEVVVRVEDDGAGAGWRPSGVGSGGHGIAGMRERVRLLAGSLDAGPRPGGGFAVEARLPRDAADGPGVARLAGDAALSPGPTDTARAD